MKNKILNNGDNISDLIFGKTDDEKRKAFKKEYNEFLDAKKTHKLEKGKKKIEMDNFNVDTAWNKLHKRFDDDGLLESKSKEFRIKRVPIMRVAAVVIILLSFSFIGYFIFNSNQEQLIIAETTNLDDVKEVKLPDGTIVFLNSDTKLAYPEEFKDNIREVKVKGEAFFQVKRNPSKPFIVHTNDANIKVLGTSFNVNTKFDNSKVEVTVKTGKVQLFSKKDTKETAFLEAGDLGTYENESVTKIRNTEENYLAWKTRNLNYKSEKLSKIVKDLNRLYKVNIEFDSRNIGNDEIGGLNFQNLPLDSILEIVCHIHRLNITKTKDKIILSKIEK